MHTIFILCCIGLSYLVGAIPFGLLFTRLFADMDVRKVGSGNIGATNVLRAAGKKAAVLTLLSDALKGLIPVLVVNILFHDDAATAFAGAAAVVGHNFPIYLNFKGGKGVATSFGVLLAGAPFAGLSCLLIWILVALIWKYSSLAALAAFSCYPILTFAVPTLASKPQQALSVFIFGMSYYRHRENIKRLLEGVEPKIVKK
jgi:acyl phosphate:glycerol-3-phosphate acyltransferase